MPYLVSVSHMTELDRRTIAAGTPGEVLMERAGKAVADSITAHFPCRPVTVLCGPGNNGGDGFVVARLLQERGRDVRVGLMGTVDALPPDATTMARRFDGKIEPLSLALLDGSGLVVDALFGVGLSRPVDGMAAELIEIINTRALPSVAVDIPSGVHGDSGEVLGIAPNCELTVTFCRRKPGHLLLPGRNLCGKVIEVDIGIPFEIVTDEQPVRENMPDIWLPHWPSKTAGGHKYTHGHVTVAAGAVPKCGAGRMAARAALRMGAGLVTVVCPSESLDVVASGQLSVMTEAIDDVDSFQEWVAEERHSTFLLGPGSGVNERTQAQVLMALADRKRCVLDADALTAFEGHPDQLFDAIKSPCILTPHEGEYKRLFYHQGSKIDRALAAANQSGGVVILKGADTVIASPDGRAAINAHAPNWLATAGAGDVLAGFCAGLLAQGMSAFEAACAAVWLHGDAAYRAGPGMIAEELPEKLPEVLRDLMPGVIQKA